MKLIEASQKQRVQTLEGNSYFSDLPEHMLKEISACMQLREYQRGDVLFWEADPCDGLHIMESGSAKIYRLSAGTPVHFPHLARRGHICRSPRV
jgi:CRP-like cAMP-binding protein